MRRPSPRTGLLPSEKKIWRDAAYLDDVDAKAWPLDIRPSDLLILAVVIAVIEVNVAVGGGNGAAPLDALSYVIVVLAYEHGLAPRPTA